MQTTSADYKLEIKKPSRSFECKITIGNNIYTNDDIVDIILETIQPGEGFSIGNTPSQTLDLTLLNRGDIIYSTSQVKVEIGLKIGSTMEYILMGYFNIDDIEKTDYTTKVTCYDNMIKFETPYFSSLTYPATLQQIVNEIATKTGVQFTGSLPAYTVKKLEGFTCREILGYVSSLCGGNALITRDGKFTIVYLKEVSNSITAENYIDYNREEIKYKIGKVSCKVGDKEINKGSLGTDSMEVKFENPWVNVNILNDIYTRLNGLSYLGYAMKWQGDISLDVGDIITCTDVKGVVRKIPILSQKFTYNGGLTSEIGAKGETKNKNSFNSSGSNSNKIDRVVTELLIANEALINKANIQDLEAVSIRTQTIEAKTAAIEVAIIDVAHISDLTAINANIVSLIAADATMGQAIIGKANIADLNAANGKINVLESNIGKIETLVNGNLTSSNIHSLVLSSDKVTVQNGFIKNAMIENVDIGKVNAGDISTNKFRIKSDNGGIEIVGATQQFKDKNGNIRIQMGQDAKGDFNFIVKGEDGKTALFDSTGVKTGAIADDLIKDKMIAENAVGEKQIDYSSFTTGFNKETNTNTLKSSKMLLDGTNQTLNVAFNSLSTTVNNVKEITTSNTTAINVQQGKIDILISNTTIVKDGVTTQLKDAYNSTVATVDSINSVISSHSSSINNLTGQITDVNTRTNDIKRTLDGTVSTVSSHTTQISGLNSTVNTQGSSISQLLNQIALKVEQTQVNTIVNGAIDGIKLGGRNLILNSKLNLTTREYLIKEFKTSINFIEGKKYTFVVKGETTSVQKFGLWMNNGSSNVGYLSKGQSGIEYITFTAVAPNNGMEKSIRIYNYPKDLVNNPSSTVEWVAMYEGEIKPPMDWTPAPEDTEEVITSISDKVATIETNLTGITSRVSGVEQTTSTIGGNVSSIDSRLKIAEQKITDSAIISTVSSTINTAKTDAINSANNSTDNKLKNYSTTTQINTAITQNATSIKQEVSNSYLSKADATTTYATKASMELTANQLKLDFYSTDIINLLSNSSFSNREITGWNMSGIGLYTGNDSYFMPTDGWRAFSLTSDRGLLYQKNMTGERLPKKNSKYTFSLSSMTESNIETFRLYIDYKLGNTYVGNQTVDLKLGNNINRYSITFTTKNADYDTFLLYIEVKPKAGTAGYRVFSIGLPCLSKGENGSYTARQNEVISGSTEIDARGVTIFNGAIDIRNRAGTSVLKGDSNGNLMVRGNLYADPANPILHLFGGCSIDATLNNEQGVGSAVRLKWNENSYIRIATDVTDIYQNGVARFRFYPNYLDCKPPTIYFADQCKIDASSGTFRFYISKSVDTGIRISPDGTIAFLVSGTPKHVFNTNGTKAGGTIVVDGATLGMSPIDSPQVLLESVLFDIDVKESGTTVLLDSTFLKTISKYAVFCSNPSVTIVSKERTSFLVQGYTGKVDFRVIGYRVGYEEQYYQLVG